MCAAPREPDSHGLLGKLQISRVLLLACVPHVMSLPGKLILLNLLLWNTVINHLATVIKR